MIKKSSFFKVLFVLVVITVILLVSNSANEAVGNSIAIGTAILGFFAILYQLNMDHNIKRAEFLYSLNDSFNSDELIMASYSKLKKNRISKQNFTDDELNHTGNYIMFFIIMNYLVNKGQVKIKMVDKIFANKFFLFCHNEDIQHAQLTVDYVKINYPIMELYETWYNYRQINGFDILYSDHQVLAMNGDLFDEKDGIIKLKHHRKPKFKFYLKKMLGKHNDETSFK